jgi:hypothetical protein
MQSSSSSSPTTEWSSSPPPISSLKSGADYDDDDMNSIGAHPSSNMYEYRESVEERIDAWRRQQQVSRVSLFVCVCDAKSLSIIHQYKFTSLSRFVFSRDGYNKQPMI